MAVEIQNNPNGNGGGGAMTAVVVILVLVIVGLAIYFGFRHSGTSGATNVNITTPAGSASGGTSGTGY